jgi:hypothetical protein
MSKAKLLANARRLARAQRRGPRPSKAKTSKRNPLKLDPTRTVALRSNFHKVIKQQFARLKLEINRLVLEEDAFGIGGGAPTTHSAGTTLAAQGSSHRPYVTNGRVGWFPSGPLVEVPDIRQPDHYSCGAACTMSVGRYWGVGPATLDKWKVALGTDEEESTQPGAIVDYLRSLGLLVSARAGMTVEELRSLTRAGIPVICPVQDYGPFIPEKARYEYGHYLVVIGAEHGYVFCQDPSEDNVVAGGDDKALSETGSIQKPGRIMIAESDWLKVWHDEDVYGNPYVQYGIAVQGSTPHPTANVFCPTGEGGGQDNSCGRGGSLAPTAPKMREWYGKATEFLDRVPGAKWMREQASHLNDKLVERYGSKQALAIIASGQAFGWGLTLGGLAATGVPVVVPFSSVLGMVPGAALAEMHYQLSSRKTSARLATNAQHLSKDKIEEQGRLLVEQLVALWSQYQGHETGAAQPHVDPLPRPPVSNVRWAFNSDPQKIRAFQDWLKQQFDQHLEGLSQEELWKRFIEAGYKKGAGRAFDDTRPRQRSIAGMTEPGMEFYRGTRSQFLESSFGRPETREKVELLSGRAFDELEGVTDSMSLKMSRSLADGLTQGKGVEAIARDLEDEVDIGKERALLIADTEIIRAHAEGQLDAMDQLGVEEVGVAVEWSTAGEPCEDLPPKERRGSGCVCPLCAAMEGVVLKLDEARGLIPRHPRCKCAWIPANVGEDDEGQVDTKSGIDRAFDKSIAGDGGEEETTWAGADKTISKSRPESIL